MSDLRQRLADIQAELDARGVKGIHFTWAPGNFTFEQRAEDAIASLRAYLDGKCTPARMYDRPTDVTGGFDG